MKRKQLLSAFLILTIGIIVYYSFQGGETAEAYTERIQKERDQKDRFMRNNEASPFRQNNIDFLGLKYFPIQQGLNVRAKFEPIENKKILSLKTSDSKSKEYLEYGYADFSIDGKPLRLLVLEFVGNEEEKPHLFLPFGDGTSAIESYGAGRYIDPVHKGGNTIQIDFNLAYNPYCAYGEGFSCPFPPISNLLEIPIQAGEKTY